MSKSLVSCIGLKVSQLKVMCGLSVASSEMEEGAVEALGCEPIPSGVFLRVYKQKLQGKQLATEFKALSKHEEEHTSNAALRNILLNTKQDVVTLAIVQDLLTSQTTSEFSHSLICGRSVDLLQPTPWELHWSVGYNDKYVFQSFVDHSRVIVWDRPEWLTTDYYNASFVDGYNGPKEYLVSQGPNSKCIVSFWHMVWQEGVTCIVMATGLFENAMQQCDKYWIDKAHKHTQHGYIHIWHEGSTYLAQLNIRTFRIQKEGTYESRLLTHYEMVGFHDESPDPGLLLDVRRRVNSLSVTQPGPILVHCRCGGGRTAVYVAVDYCLHQLHSEDRVDVYSTVLHLRRFRKNMIRTLAQYEQIYQAVAMYLQCGTTVYPAQTLVAAYQVHYSSEAKAFKLEREFQTLHSIVLRLTIGDCASGHRVENRSKSRDIMMLPPECARPYLSTADCGENGTDFINAVYIDGYHTENTYLATQWPLKRTIADFWRMLFDFKITSLVLMNDLHKFTRSYPRFWPKEVEHVASYGPISVRYLSCSKLNHTTIRTFAIRKPKRHPHLIAQTLMRISEDVMIMNNLVGCEVRQDEVIVKMFQVLNSVSDGSIKCYTGHNSSLRSHCHGSSDIDTKSKKQGIGIVSKSLLAVMEHVSDWQRRNNSRQPICVMSKDGCSRVGLFCVISFCCDQVKAEKEVDVFNAVRLVRKNRPQLIPNLEEYRYIYHFMSEFILLSATKPEVFDAKSPMGLASHSGSFYQMTKSQVCSSNSFHGGVYVININKEEKNSKKDNYSDNKVQISHELHGAETTKSFHNDICEDKMFSLNSVFCKNLMSENNQASLSINLFPNSQSATNFSDNQHRSSSGQTAVPFNIDGLTISNTALQPVDRGRPNSLTSMKGLSTQHQVSSLSSLNKPSIILSPIPYFQEPSHISSSNDSYSKHVHSMISSDSSNSFLTSDIFKHCSPPSQVNHCSINISQGNLNNSFISSHSNGSLYKKEFPETNQYSFHSCGIPSSDLTQTIVQHSSRSTQIQSMRNYQNQTSLGNGTQHFVRFNEDVVNGQIPLDIKLIHASYASLEESSSSEDNHADSLDCISEEHQLKHDKESKKKNTSAYHSHSNHQNGGSLMDPTLVMSSAKDSSSSNSLKQKIKSYITKTRLNKEKLIQN